MKLLADVNIEREIIEGLRNSGFDVLWAAEGFGNLEDAELLKIANTQNRILLSNDKDFGEIVFRQRLVTSGIILLRMKGISAIEKTEILLSFLNRHKDNCNGRFIVIAKEKVRIISL